LSVEDGIDVMDLNPYKQSFHKTTEIHPVAKVIIFFVKNSITFKEQPFALLNSLIGELDSAGEGETTFGSVMKDAFAFLGNIMEWVGDKIVGYLEEAGQINRAVNDQI